MGMSYGCTVLKQMCQHKVMISRWCRHHPCSGHCSMSVYGTTWASPMSLLGLGACMPQLPCGMVLAHLRQEAGLSQSPLVSSYPMSGGGKASAQPGAVYSLLYSLGSGGRLTCQSNALQGMLVFLKLWH